VVGLCGLRDIRGCTGDFQMMKTSPCQATDLSTKGARPPKRWRVAPNAQCCCVVEYGCVVRNLHFEKMVPRGLEPRTLRLLAVRSNQLSYETDVKPAGAWPALFLLGRVQPGGRRAHLLPAPSSLLPGCLLPAPSSLLPAPLLLCSLPPAPCSLLPAPCSLAP
jgi:hypothetical protein